MKEGKREVNGRPGRFVGVGAAARAMGCGVDTIKRMARAGQFQYFTTTGGHYRVFLPDDGVVPSPVRPGGMDDAELESFYAVPKK